MVAFFNKLSDILAMIAFNKGWKKYSKIYANANQFAPVKIANVPDKISRIDNGDTNCTQITVHSNP